jgi:hypothetical protein
MSSAPYGGTHPIPRVTPYPTLMYALPIGRVREVLAQVVPSAILESVLEIPSTRLCRLYILNLSGSRRLLLSFAPSSAVRLLRQEQKLLLSEATLVYFLDKMSGSKALSESVDGRPTSPDLAKLVPKLLRHSSNTREMGYPYSIFEPATGAPLSTQTIYLSIPERQHVDRQIGSFVRDLAAITSPTGKFGAVAKVYGDLFTQAPGSPSGSSRSGGGSGGSPNWPEAFMSLMEGILRDGEDMSVLLPYDIIRRHLNSLSWRLRAVTTPRLVIIDAGEDLNVMVERQLEDGPLPPEEAVKITGLRDWTQGIFGDPLLSSCFDNPSESFMEGWKAAGEELIEDEEGTETRLLLYKCYRATVDIVIEYHRPRPESSRNELEARRKLTNALTQLAKADLEAADGSKRSRSNSISGVVGSPKKQKTDL